jgi:hypothetical protein
MPAVASREELEIILRAKDEASKVLKGFADGATTALGAATLAVGALATGAVAAAGLIIKLGEHGSKIAKVADSFDALAKSVGASSQAIIESGRAATKGLVTDYELMAAANKGILLGLPITAKEFGTLAEAAIRLGRATERGPTQALNDLILGLARGSPRILDNIGIIVKGEDAYKAYASAIGTSVKDLTQAEKTMAVYSAAVEAAQAKIASMGEMHLTFADHVLQARTSVQNFVDSLARAVATSPVINRALETIVAGFDAAFGSNKATQIAAIMKLVENYAVALVNLGKVTVEVARFVTNAWLGIEYSIRLGIAVIGELIAQVFMWVEGAHRAASSVPIIGSLFADSAKQAREVADATRSAADSLVRDMETVGDRAAASNASFDKMGGFLTKLQGDMRAAGEAGRVAMGEIGTGSKAATGHVFELGEAFEKLEARQLAGVMKVEEATLKSFETLDKAGAAHTARMAAEDEKAWDAQEKLLREEEALSEKMRRAELEALEEQVKHREALAKSFASLADVFGSTREALVAMGVDGDSALMRITTGLQTAASAAEGFFSALASGDTFGMIGSAIGGAIGIASALGIGGDRQIMQVNDLRDAFFEAHGGWLELQKDLANLTDQDLVAKIFNAKTVEQFNAAVAAAMDLLDTQARAQEELQAAIEKYGITIEELGPKFAQQELDKQAAQLLKEFELLSAAGVDVNTLIAKMGPGLVEFVETSIAAGATIPEAMRPVIEQLIAQGLLLDENGEAYTSAEDAGIRFAETLTESMQSVIEEIRNLVAALTGVPNVSRTVTVTTRHQDTYDEGDSGKGPPPDMDRGGIIGRNVLPFIPRAAEGMLTGSQSEQLARVHANEVVAPVQALFEQVGRAAAAAAAAAGGGGGGTVHVHVHVADQEIANTVVRLNRAGRLPIATESLRKTS